MEKGPQSNESYERQNPSNRTISTVLWVHKKLPQSTVKLVLPSNESYESRTGCNRTLPTVLWVPLTFGSWTRPRRKSWTSTPEGSGMSARNPGQKVCVYAVLSSLILREGMCLICVARRWTRPCHMNVAHHQFRFPPPPRKKVSDLPQGPCHTKNTTVIVIHYGGSKTLRW